VAIEAAVQVDIAACPGSILTSVRNTQRIIMRNRIRSTAAVFVLLLLSALIPSPGGSQTPPIKGNMVYVCACLNTKSCSCMTEAKTEGPCACGTKGGPPLKAVPKDSAWAKENRDALAK
jgi:hypothetical protein